MHSVRFSSLYVGYTPDWRNEDYRSFERKLIDLKYDSGRNYYDNEDKKKQYPFEYAIDSDKKTYAIYTGAVLSPFDTIVMKELASQTKVSTEVGITSGLRKAYETLQMASTSNPKLTLADADQFRRSALDMPES